ncbi:GAF domain-containing protein [Methylobacterium planeticum]|uniref:GAF domain-containing protein n=1 Tax=Methylobacterium planeticum TaxID=2615211 RepID=A0A6N6MZT2_9HYPH|nr:GAF domain-containing protein [Methylobacterium planeticum]KAB1076120.1 GAF domain-containing protein [Methylobacterium planeticum]
MLESWRYIVNAVAVRLKVPVGLIMRRPGPEIEVCVVNDDPRNQHAVGWRSLLEGSGLSCEAVLREGRALRVPNARADALPWDTNPCLLEHGLLTDLGYPIRWPDGTLFGTLCVLDAREKTYSRQDRDVMGLMRDLIESNLRTLCAA